MSRNVLDYIRTIGGVRSNNEEREEMDYYATEPKATELLCDILKFNHNIWEPACGEGHISNVLQSHGYNVVSTDLIDRGYGTGGIDFLNQSEKFNGDIVTNPPYKIAGEFVKHALDLSCDGNCVAMLLKLTFAEGKERRKFFDIAPPKYIYVSSSRLKCAKNGDFNCVGSSAMCYAWWIWYKGYQGETIMRWFN